MPGGQEDEVGLVEAGDGGVHVHKAGGEPRHRVPAGGQLVEPVVDPQDDGGDVLQALGTAALADGIDALLGGLQGLLGGGGALLDKAGDGPRRLGDAPQEGLVPDDVHVLHHVGRRGGDDHELADVVIGGVLVVDPGLAHLVQHGHRVDGLGKIEHGADRLIDLPVLPEIEILRLQRFDHLGHAPLVDEDGAQHRLFRLHRVGHLAGEQFVHVRSPLSSLVDAARWAGLTSPRSPPR